MTYKVSIQTSPTQKDEIKDPANIYLILYGEGDQTERLHLNDSTETFTIRPGERNEFQFKTTDVGKVCLHTQTKQIALMLLTHSSFPKLLLDTMTPKNSSHGISITLLSMET